MPSRRILLGLVVVALVIGCTEEPIPAPPPNNSWFNAVDKSRHEFLPLPPFLFSPVKEELVNEAVEAMSDGPLLQLSTGEAIRYADDRLRTMRGLRPFLIHGLYRTKRLFNISIADRALWVDSLDDALDTSPVRRQPIVLYMDEVPPDVFVTVGWQLAEDKARQTEANSSDGSL